MSEIEPIFTEKQLRELGQTLNEAFRPMAEAAKAIVEAYGSAARKFVDDMKRAAHPE